MTGMQRHFKLRPSRFLAALLLIVCCASLVSLWTLPLPTMVLFALTLLVLVWGGYCVSRYALLRADDSCVAFRLEEDSGVVLVLRNGSHLMCRLCNDSLVTSGMVILNAKVHEQRGGRSVLIFPDAMGGDSFRRLRVALKWGEFSQGAT